MIKNARELTLKENSEFRAIYTRYFSESCLTSKGNIPKFLASFINTARNQRYAASMLRLIENGTREAFVSFDDDEETITGFLVGYIGEGNGDISHLFIDVKCPIGRRIQGLELFKAFSEEAMKRGIRTFKAESEVTDAELNDTLNSLGFSITKRNGNVNEYGHNIK